MERIKFDSYESYVAAQRKTVRRRGEGPFFTHWEFDRIAEWLKLHGVDENTPLHGICHGARAGMEGDEIQKHFPQADVFGTDLFPYSGDSAIRPGKSKVIEHNFSEQKPEWVGAFDLVYSNSLDHARDPVQALAVWMEQLKPTGHLFLQWCRSSARAYKADCFGADLSEYITLMNNAGVLVDLLYIHHKRNRRNRLERRGVEVVVMVVKKTLTDEARPPGTYPLKVQSKHKNSIGPRQLTRAHAEAERLAAVIPVGSSVIDIGASIGAIVKELKDLGYESMGIDGTPGIEQLTDGLVQWADLTGDCSRFHGIADWATFIEVGEHVPQEFEQQLIDNVSKIPRKGLIASWASPGQQFRGYHINSRTIEYVQGEFTRRGWVIDEQATKLIRQGRSRRKRILTVYRRQST